MITSANLSKHAWGDVENKSGEIWIQSWECGVVFFPALFKDDGDDDGDDDGEVVKMVPVFGRDVPERGDVDGDGGDGGVGREGVEIKEGGKSMDKKKVVSFRMPYDLPLEPYKQDEVPWCASADYEEPDWKGMKWT